MVITHVLADCYECSAKIEDEAALVDAAKAAAAAVGATVIGEYAVRYVPHGITVAVFLAESHIILTTWPEYRLLLVDVLLCNDAMDYRLALGVIQERLGPIGRVVTHDVPRKVAAA